MSVKYNEDKTKFKNPLPPYRWIRVNSQTHKNLCRDIRLGRLSKEYEQNLPPCEVVKKVGRPKKQHEPKEEQKSEPNKKKKVKIKIVPKKIIYDPEKEYKTKTLPKKEKTKTKKRKKKITPNKNVIDLNDFGDVPIFNPSRSIIEEPQKINNVLLTPYIPPSIGTSEVNIQRPEPKPAPVIVENKIKKTIELLEKEVAQRKQYRDAGREVIKRRGKKIEQTIAGKKARGPIKEPKLSFAQVLAGKNTNVVTPTLSFIDMLTKGRMARRVE